MEYIKLEGDLQDKAKIEYLEAQVKEQEKGLELLNACVLEMSELVYAQDFEEDYAQHKNTYFINNNIFIIWKGRKDYDGKIMGY